MFTTAADLLRDLETGKVSSVEVTQAYLEQIEKHDTTIGAFLKTDPEQALAEAADIDRRRAKGETLGLLAGLPVTVKDLLCTKDRVTTCGSRMLENFVPPYDATVIERLKAADAVLIGKTNMDEFAMGGSCENSAFHPTRNPWENDCVSGGSSGGAAASVAAGMTPLAVGTDTGGSIRQPAAFCGVVGLKPTYGRVSRYGLVAFASSLDQAGPLAVTAEDAALLLEAISGHDGRDSTSAPVSTPRFSQSVKQPLESLTLGVARDQLAEGLDDEVGAFVEEAIQVFASQGAKVKDISLPHSKYGVATYYIIAPCEASSNLARYDGAHYGYRTDEAAMLEELEQERKRLSTEKQSETDVEHSSLDLDSPLVRMYRRTRAEGFGAEVKRRIMLGTYALSKGYYDAYYLKALKVRRLIRRDFDRAFEQVDMVIGPTTPTPAFKIGEKTNDPLSMYLGDLYTVLANLAGAPAISLPCGFTTAGLPIGLQLQAPPFEEERLLRAAAMYQQATDWHRQTAPALS